MFKQNQGQLNRGCQIYNCWEIVRSTNLIVQNIQIDKPLAKAVEEIALEEQQLGWERPEQKMKRKLWGGQRQAKGTREGVCAKEIQELLKY